MNSILLFSTIIILTFLSGFQNKNIIGGHYVLAFFTSLLLGGAGILLYKVMPTADVNEMIAYVLAGPIGIVLSMFTHDRFVFKKSKRQCNGCCQCRAEIDDKKQPG